jgi:hypothetical protein
MVDPDNEEGEGDDESPRGGTTPMRSRAKSQHAVGQQQENGGRSSTTARILHHIRSQSFLHFPAFNNAKQESRSTSSNEDIEFDRTDQAEGLNLPDVWTSDDSATLSRDSAIGRVQENALRLHPQGQRESVPPE